MSTEQRACGEDDDVDNFEGSRTWAGRDEHDNDDEDETRVRLSRWRWSEPWKLSELTWKHEPYGWDDYTLDTRHSQKTTESLELMKLGREVNITEWKLFMLTMKLLMSVGKLLGIVVCSFFFVEKSLQFLVFSPVEVQKAKRLPRMNVG